MNINDAMDSLKNLLSMGVNLPQKITDQWLKIYRNFVPPNMPWSSFWRFGEEKNLPFGSLNLYEEWLKIGGESIRRVAQLIPESAGSQTLFKTFESMKAYWAVYEFWIEWTRIMAPFRGKIPTGQQWETIQEKLMEKYRKVLDTVIGKKPPETLEELVKMHGTLFGESLEYLNWFKKPLSKIVKSLPDIGLKAISGDISSVKEGLSLWNTAVTETIGKLLNIPSFGYSREHEERVKTLIDAYIKFITSLPSFYSEFYGAGLKAFDKIIEKSKDLPLDTSPESFRKFYEIWWKTNEDVFFDLFKRDEFASMMNEVMKKGLIFKKRLDDNVSKVLESLSIPNRREMDDVYRELYELKKEVRNLAKDIREMKEK